MSKENDSTNVYSILKLRHEIRPVQNQLSSLNHFGISRNFKHSYVVRFEMQGYCDSSKQAY